MNASQDLLLRIKSDFGTSRVTLNKNSPFSDLKSEVL